MMNTYTANSNSFLSTPKYTDKEEKLFLSPIYRKLFENKIEYLEEPEKKKLYVIVDKTYPNFRPSLFKSCPDITPDELCMCYLLKLNIKSIRIAKLMRKQRSSISMKQSRLVKKIFDKNESAKLLKDFIGTL